MTTKFPSHVKTRPPMRAGFLARFLDPIDQLSGAIYSVMIILTFTLAYRIFRLAPETSPDYTSRIFYAALGATFAAGLIDGVMYILLRLLERGEKHRLLQTFQSAVAEEECIEVIADELDDILEPITGEAKRQELYAYILKHLKDSQAQPVRLNREDLLGALGSMFVAVIAVMPSLAPLFLLKDDPNLAISISNVVSFVALFLMGHRWGRYSGANPWRTGLQLAAIAVVMVLITIPLER